MTKADLVETIYEKIGFSRKESAEIVDLVFDLMKETLEGGEKIKISGFGNLKCLVKMIKIIIDLFLQFIYCIPYNDFTANII